MKEKVLSFLKSNSDEKYKKFTSSLSPDNDMEYIGVRLPVLKKYAKSLGEKEKVQYLKITPFYFEEKMLQGMIIGQLKGSYLEILNYVEEYIPKINCWAVCDTFCSGLKFINKNKKEFFEFIKKYIESNEPYERRFFLVILKCYFVEKEYLNEIFKITENFKLEHYYVKMALAWLISECYIKYKDETFEFLLKTNLEDDTFNKALRKIAESLRVDSKTKQIMRKMYRKNLGT